MVVIIDPHVKRVSDYPVYSKGQELDVFVKNPSNGEYEGWCWPGSSSWVDFFNPKAWPWWSSLYKIGGNSKDWHWTQSTEDLFIWNDMNEPSVFNGPEITMPKDNIHYGGWEHRDVHNINGMLYVSTLFRCGMSSNCLYFSKMRRTRRFSLALLRPSDLSYLRDLSSLARSALGLCGRVTTWVHGSTWQSVSPWCFPSTSRV
jgi:hypothetical protein